MIDEILNSVLFLLIGLEILVLGLVPQYAIIGAIAIPLVLLARLCAVFVPMKVIGFKIPKQLDLHDALPREDSGKIFKERLRAPYWDETGRKI